MFKLGAKDVADLILAVQNISLSKKQEEVKW
jgi:hypothetical protein